ncbi:GDP-L-fucose synthase [Desulfocarbo indianensis]|nr:GDP-L-fucose synthase [Desulfocarbo indianensis]
MPRQARIFVAGHRGLVGSSVSHSLRRQGFENLLERGHAELDLTDQAQVRRFFEAERPEYVFLCAARVGGIGANQSFPGQFIYDNLAIQVNVLHQAWRSGVKKLLFLGSSCIYPRECPQPMREEYLLSGPLEPTNRPYAVAKIAGVEMCWAYNRQYETRFLAVMPTNLFGPRDNYDLRTSHVVPAIIRKMHEAKVAGRDEVILWGTGRPRREFLYSRDLGDACVYLLDLPEERFLPLVTDSERAPLVNIGYGQDVTIRELADMVASVVGFAGRIVWDASQPDGTPQKLLDSERIQALGWRPRTPLRRALELTYRHYQQEVDQQP